jgi:hypothetical protein
LVGTPYFPEVQGGVLFLEDVAEHPYRLERMLTQLLHAGVLAQQKAIVLGAFTDYKLTPHDKGFKLPTVVDWLRAQLKTPVLTGLPFGHVPTKLCLPVGKPVTLLREGQEAFLLWAHPHHGHRCHRHRRWGRGFGGGQSFGFAVPWQKRVGVGSRRRHRYRYQFAQQRGLARWHLLPRGVFESQVVPQRPRHVDRLFTRAWLAVLVVRQTDRGFLT